MAYQRTPMGDSASDLMDRLKQYANTAIAVGSQVQGVLEDPYLPEIACRINQLHAIEKKTPLPPCAKTPPGKRGGIGLRNVAPVLRAYVYAEQHPIVKPVAIAALLGVPFLVGYLVGKRR